MGTFVVHPLPSPRRSTGCDALIIFIQVRGPEFHVDSPINTPAILRKNSGTVLEASRCLSVFGLPDAKSINNLDVKINGKKEGPDAIPRPRAGSEPLSFPPRLILKVFQARAAEGKAKIDRLRRSSQCQTIIKSRDHFFLETYITISYSQYRG